jgi:hypothetical protein
MHDTAMEIIEASRVQRQRQAVADHDDAPVSGTPRVLGGQAAVAEKRVRKGVLPGSFVTHLEAWKSKYEGGKEVSDKLVGPSSEDVLLRCVLVAWPVLN